MCKGFNTIGSNHTVITNYDTPYYLRPSKYGDIVPDLWIISRLCIPENLSAQSDLLIYYTVSANFHPFTDHYSIRMRKFKPNTYFCIQTHKATISIYQMSPDKLWNHPYFFFLKETCQSKQKYESLIHIIEDVIHDCRALKILTIAYLLFNNFLDIHRN